MLENKEVERLLITKYRKSIYRPFMKAVRDYDMIKENDKIAVCISGGKDSFMLAKCLLELKLHGNTSFELVFLVMNPGYKSNNVKKIKELAKALELDVTIFDSDIFEVANKLDSKHPCYMCARMRRGCLYNKAKELGCNKIALGHHFDDVIETILLAMFYGAEFKTMMPKLKSTNFEGMELIRPLYLVKEESIISFWNNTGYEFINCACSFTEKVSSEGKRSEIKELINSLRKKSKLIDQNIFKSAEKVNLETIISYQDKGKVISFLDDYSEGDVDG